MFYEDDILPLFIRFLIILWWFFLQAWFVTQPLRQLSANHILLIWIYSNYILNILIYLFNIFKLCFYILHTLYVRIWILPRSAFTKNIYQYPFRYSFNVQVAKCYRNDAFFVDQALSVAAPIFKMFKFYFRSAFIVDISKDPLVFYSKFRSINVIQVLHPLYTFPNEPSVTAFIV
jgi:hypothetical protein